MRLKKHYLCTALSLAFTQQAVAAQESDSLTVWSSPVSSTTTTVLDQPTMKALDKQNVAQALSVVPGVVLQKSGSRNEEQVKVRGFDSRQVPVYFDGVPIYVPYDGNLDLARILTNNLGAVEVSKGIRRCFRGLIRWAEPLISPPRSQQNLWKQVWDIARDGAVARTMPTICMLHLPPVAIWGICKSAVAS